MKTKHIRYIQLQKTKSRMIDIGGYTADNSPKLADPVA